MPPASKRRALLPLPLHALHTHKPGTPGASRLSACLPILQAMWLYILPVDALEVVRTSALKVAKAAQAVAKFFLQVRDRPDGCMHVCV